MNHTETATQGEPSGYEGARLSRKPILSWIDGGGRHTREVSESLVLGAAEGVGLMIADPAVSRLHAELEFLDSGLWVRDLESPTAPSFRAFGSAAPVFPTAVSSGSGAPISR